MALNTPRLSGMSLLDHFSGRSGLVLAWAIALGVFAILGFMRVGTEAQFAFASAAIIPVFLVTWSGGFAHGIFAACLAMAMWVISDVMATWQSGSLWIHAVNGLTRLATYGFVAFLTACVREMHARELEWSRHDPLTGLLNRRAFMLLGEAEVIRARRYRHPLALAFLDLDNFKTLNDHAGHPAGDAALRATGMALLGAMRDTDAVARLGGDEFGILMLGVTESNAAQTGERISGALAEALAGFPPVGASIGIALFETPPKNFSTMLNASDSLMYQAKRAGKGRVAIDRFSTDEDVLTP